jgi:hypothetical protein
MWKLGEEKARDFDTEGGNRSGIMPVVRQKLRGTLNARPQ